MGTARGRVEAVRCRRWCFRGTTEVGLMMILVGTLVASGSKLKPMATFESLELSLMYFVQEDPSLW